MLLDGAQLIVVCGSHESWACDQLERQYEDRLAAYDTGTRGHWARIVTANVPQIILSAIPSRRLNAGHKVAGPSQTELQLLAQLQREGERVQEMAQQVGKKFTVNITATRC